MFDEYVATALLDTAADSLTKLTLFSDPLFDAGALEMLDLCKKVRVKILQIL